MLAARLFIFKVSIESPKIRLPILSRCSFHAPNIYFLTSVHKMPVFSWKIVPACTMEHKDLWNCNQYLTKYFLNSTFCLDRYQSYKTSREIDKKNQTFHAQKHFFNTWIMFLTLSKFSLFTTTFQTQIAQNLFIRPVHLKTWDYVVFLLPWFFWIWLCFKFFLCPKLFSMFFRKTTKPMVKN